MKLNFLSLPYFICLFLCAVIVAALFFAFRKCPRGVKIAAVLILMLLNIAQHLLKCFVWPHLYGTGFQYHNTAYNVCATLILLSPFVFLFGGQASKDAMLYLGTGGPLLAIVVPFWFEGQSVFSWEVLRFYVCHLLLIATSLLPALWRLHRPSYRSFAAVPLCFFFVLGLILINAIVCAACGLIGSETEDLFTTLYALNPCWAMHPAPPAGFEWVQTALELFTPSVFLGNAERPYVPLLWYFIPMYLLMAVLSLLLGIALDFKRFRKDLGRLFSKRHPKT